jgi:hypothetical protein
MPDFRLSETTIAGTPPKKANARVRSDPVGQRLRGRRLGVGVARRTEGCDEQLAGMHLAGRRVKNVDRRAGIIDEQLLASHVRLPHRRRQAAFPGAIQFAKPAAAVTVGMGGAVLLPHQLQRHALAAQLAMNRRPVRPRPPVLGRGRRRRIQAAFQRDVTEIVGQWPTDTGLTRPAQARPGSGRADPEARCDLTLGKAGG